MAAAGRQEIVGDWLGAPQHATFPCGHRFGNHRRYLGDCSRAVRLVRTSNLDVLSNAEGSGPTTTFPDDMRRALPPGSPTGMAYSGWV